MTAVGTVVGRFELLRLLAAGGMGEVYLARVRSSVEGFGALVAIKLLGKNLCANPSFVKMFLDEARAVAKLHHKNIVQVRDIAGHDGQYYMVMEYVAGQNLRELLGDASIPDRPLFGPRLGTEIFTEVASALAAAHAEEIVHRDVSPNNIMIGDEGVAKLIDFGIARALGTASDTTPGTLKGNFGYMAPEYVRAGAYDHRVDLFSLGVVMWETFARRRLFRGTSAAEQLHQLLEGEIPRLDTVVPEIPASLAAIVARALERDPEKRISSATELVDALTEVTRILPVGTDPTLRKWLERRMPGRLEDRRQTDQTLLMLPQGSSIPDFGMAYPEAGSTVGSYGFNEASGGIRVSGVHASKDSATSGRIAPGETIPPAPETAPPGRKRGRTIAITAALALAVGAVVFAVSRGSHESEPTAATTPEGSAAASAPDGGGPEVSLAEAHRQIGLKALADGDYAKARAEFAEALHTGGGGDLKQLIDMATQLEHDDRAATAGSAAQPVGSAAHPEPSTAIEIAASTPASSTPARSETKTPPARKTSSGKTRDRGAHSGERERAAITASAKLASADSSAVPSPNTSHLAVVSVVPNAVVQIDGSVAGQTPVLVNVTPGEHRLVVKSGDQILHSTTLRVAAGETSRINVETPLSPPPQPPPPPQASPPPHAVAAAAPPPVKRVAARAPTPTPRVTTDGDVGAGARALGACNSCHVKDGASVVAGRRYTRAQWERFFASGQHDRYVAIGDQMTTAQLMAVRAFLRANAADAAENQGAGIRE